MASSERTMRLLCAAVGASIAVIGGCSAPEPSPVATLSLRHAYGGASTPPGPCDAWPIAPAGIPPGREGRHHLHFCGTIPSARELGHPRAPALAIPPGAQALRVEVNGRLLHEPHPLDDRGISAGLETVWLPIEPSDLGAPLAIRVDSLHPVQIGLLGAVRAGDHAALVAETLRHDAPACVFGLFLVLVGLIASVTYRPRGEWRLAVAFAASALSLGVYSLHYTQLRDLLTEAPRLWTAAWMISVAVAPAAVLTVLVDALELPPSHGLARLRRFHVGLGAVYTAGVVVVYPSLSLLARATAARVLQVTTVLDVILRLGVAVTALGILSFAAVRLARGDRAVRWVALGLVAPCVVSAFDVIRYLSGAARAWGSAVPFGYFSLVLGLAALLRDRHEALRVYAAAQSREVVRRTEERAQMLRDLHDGVGSLVGNIRQLAQIVEQGGERGHRAALRVEQMAGEAVLELRDVTSAASREVEDWRLLCAALRRSAAQLVEAHERPFAFTDQVDGDAPLPPPELALHLRRFVREAVHNALKHTRTGAVSVSIAVDRASIVVEVGDEGGPPPVDPPASLGIGLESLARRAKALGGELEIALDVERGSRVTLRLPQREDAI